MIPTTINERWTLLLPEHRHDRLEWPVWEKERLAAMYDVIGQEPSGVMPNLGVVPPRDLVFDIGAEEGDFPALWAQWGADVVLVEPNPLVWPNIRAIFEANDLVGHLRGWHVGFAGDIAACDRQSVATIDAWRSEHVVGLQDMLNANTRDWPACAFGRVIGDHGFLVLPERPDCEVTTIDRLAARFGPPTVITIDVEGAELTVLRGALVTLRENRPAVFVSVHLDLPWIDEKYPGDTGDKVTEYMEGLGYEGRHLATDHEEHWEWRHPNGR